ncbi:hypothetical protein [Haloplasma contractile]|uniref:Uncharacterized protein n=1 Tax=Haloplasma contractile SSD-17B TaxID=1033810 RepID=F7PVX8_9MOLU|nr:hypothetical protein [Haloplasma contractile]ERJ12698.1 hypothetical protein HLPCO_001038 [Haloplasma contractile SSD-17B]
MSIKKIFFLKIIGLYGLIVSITGFIMEILCIINNLRFPDNRSISVKLFTEFIQHRFMIHGLYILFFVLIIIGSFIMLFIGRSRESYVKRSDEKGVSLENQVVGIFLLFSAIMYLSSLIRNIGVYFQYKNHNNYPEELLSINSVQIFLSLFPIVVYSVIGILLLTYSYRKRVVYKLKKNE